jgi:hypothetical protein
LFTATFGANRLLLACTRLEFASAPGGRPVAVEAPLAADFAAVLGQLRRNHPASPE